MPGIDPPPYPAPGQIPGTKTNDDAAAGNVGEVVQNSVAGASLTTATPINITSISLTAGDWDVAGAIFFIQSGGVVLTGIFGGTNTVSASFPTDPDPSIFSMEGDPPGPSQRLPVGLKRYSLSAPATVYLVGQANFTVSPMTADGYLWARRAR